jgi:hypothetical protein
MSTPLHSLRSSERVQVLLDPETKRGFEDLARREGMSLSAWLRAAGLDRAAKQQGERRFRNLGELDAFFAECVARETGREPDWEEHKAAIARSFSRGDSDT